MVLYMSKIHQMVQNLPSKFAENTTVQISLTDLLSLTSNLHVLYVEDDVVLRENTVALLRDLFHQIDEASDGVEALKCYKEHPNGYDIVINYLTSKQTAKELKEKIDKQIQITKNHEKGSTAKILI